MFATISLVIMAASGKTTLKSINLFIHTSLVELAKFSCTNFDTGKEKIVKLNHFLHTI